MNAEKIPQELKNKDQWILWKTEKRNDENTKVPYQPNGEYASSTNKETWSDFETVKNAEGDFDGIGFVFSDKDLIVGVDLDDCRDPETGEMSEKAKDIIDSLNSYTEISPSGSGFHVICRGSVPPGKTRNNKIEMYDHARYFTFTGKHVPETPESVENRPQEIKEVHSEYVAEEIEKKEIDWDKESKEVKNTELSDSDIIEILEERIPNLWSGNISQHQNDHSRADLALCSHLAFWTGGDPYRIEQLFEQSGLTRDKWFNREDYREMTINKAIKGQTEFYDPEESNSNPAQVEDIKARTKDVDKESVEIASEYRNEWEFKNILPKNHFVTKQIELGKDMTDAYPEYHWGQSLSLLSVALDRNAKIMVGTSPKYTNLYFLLVGYSTLSRKTTAMNDIGKEILKNANLEHRRTDADFSPEALIDILADNPNTYFHKDEIGKLFTNIKQGSYQKTMPIIFANIYNCEPMKRKLRSEEIETDPLYFNMLGACVPRQVGEGFDEDDLESGFLPRVNVIWAERPKEWEPQKNFKEEWGRGLENLGDWLNAIYEFFNYFKRNHGTEAKFELSDEALEVWNNWNRRMHNFMSKSDKGKRFTAYAGRMSNTVIKLACLIEVGSSEFLKEILGVDGEKLNKQLSNIRSISSISKLSTNFLTQEQNFTYLLKNGYPISKQSVEMAIFYASKLLLPNADYMQKYIESFHGSNDVRYVYEKAKKHSNGGNISHSDLVNRIDMTSREYQPVIKALVEGGKFVPQETKGGGRKYLVVDVETEDELPGIDIDADDFGEIEIPKEIKEDLSEIEENDKDESKEDMSEKPKKESENEKNFKNKIRKTIENLNKDEPEDREGCMRGDLLAEVEKLDEKTLEELKSEGFLYEPMPGYIAVV